ncbi:MAG TPA: LLM class F420-dependent oxidoreductase [Tepidiformaceae bacterium]|nr:LLM class F420-dependent oxidoreductase [Tepidiformaceae bacterium]
MRIGFWPGPNNSWDDTVALSRHAESTGWDSVWFADHFMPNAEDNSGPTAECWTTLAALAVSVPRVRLGSLVVGNTYRHPAVLAKMAANVDILSGGRLVLGLGAGWQENEHAAYGIEFSTVGGRLARLEEACQVVNGLLRQDRTDLDGKYYRLADAPLAPKPVHRVPLLIGGGGEQKTLRIAAKYADEWNVWGTPEFLRQKMAVLDQRCEEISRDPGEIERSANAMLTISDDASRVERAKAAGPRVIAGNAEQVGQQLRDYSESGVHELIIPDFNLGRDRAAKVEMMDRFREIASRALA